MNSLRRLLCVCACLTTLTAVTPARAGGFYVPEIGARSTGLGGAVTADSADPSMIFHNPAGLTGVGGTQIAAGGLLVLPRVTY